MKGFLLLIATLFAVLKLQQCVGNDQCLLFREMCPFTDSSGNPTQWCPDPNELRCRRLGPVSMDTCDKVLYKRPILTEKNMRVFTSPTFVKKRYKSKLHAKYNVRCDDSPDQFMFCNVSTLDIRGKDCYEKYCRDYLEISRDEQALGPIEFCEEEYQKLRFVAVGGFKATFRTNHHQEYVNGMWKEKKWVTRAPNDYYEGFQTYCMCFNDESPTSLTPPTNPDPLKRSVRTDFDAITFPTPGVDNGCKQKSGTFSTDLFPNYPKYRLAKDLDTFHRQWRRMVEGRNDKELIIEYILYNQTVKYCDGTISILEDGIEVKKHRYVKFIKTFDSTGKIRFHVGRVLGVEELSGPGPLVIACKCGFFQMFVIDTRDIFPNELETPQLNIMIEPFLSLQQHYDQDELYQYTNYTIYNYTDYYIEDPTIMLPRNTTSFNNAEEDAVIVAYLNENACNPVLREQSKVTIGYFSGINRTLAENLLPFSMSCSVRCRSLTTGEHVIIVQCTSQSVILPGNTTCTVGNNPSTQCDPFSSGGVEFPEDKKNSILVVTSVNILGQRGMLFLSLKQSNA